jgi:hypothetical protein
VAIAWDVDPVAQPDRRQLLDNWYQQAVARYGSLLELIEAVQRYPLPQPTGSHDSMVEYDRQRMIKDSLLEQVIATCVQTADAGRLLCAASGQAMECVAEAERGLDVCASLGVLRGVLAGDVVAVAKHWHSFTELLAKQELLYVPLAKGGRPRRIVRARACGQLINDLLGWLPRLGLVRETCQLLDIAQAMEIEHPVGPARSPNTIGCGLRLSGDRPLAGRVGGGLGSGSGVV